MGVGMTRLVLRPSGGSRFGETYTWVVKESKMGMSCVKWVCGTKSVTGCWRRDNEMWGEGVWAAGLERGEHGVCNTFRVKKARLEPCAGPLEGRDVSGQGAECARGDQAHAPSGGRHTVGPGPDTSLEAPGEEGQWACRSLASWA